jgi:hypothetical protein
LHIEDNSPLVAGFRKLSKFLAFLDLILRHIWASPVDNTFHTLRD